VTDSEASATEGWDFFVSYTGDDQSWAEWISWQLEAAGYRVMIEAWDLVPGTNWVERMQAGLTRATRLLAVVSPSYVSASRFGAAEWQAAWATDPDGALRKVIPVRVAECERPGLLAGIVGADLFDVSEAAAAQRLQKAVTDALAGRAKPITAPGFPGTEKPSPEATAVGGTPTSPPFPPRTSSSQGQPRDQEPPAAGGVVRSVYLQQVARIAPPASPGSPGLVGRDAELAELAEFCAAPDPDPDTGSGCGSGRGAYAWWRAPAWAGKSALMATFVLHPPEQIRGRVRIVSFFITARLAAQDTRDAFTAALLDQLRELNGQELPPSPPEPMREAFLLDLLARAARTCYDEGQRLVLVVDGLDEDRGVITGPDAHSIAGMLPVRPQRG
jgi:hypothetical protein